jgi:preprotein translocase subunit YajC
MHEIFNDNLKDLKWLPPVRFKGGSSQTTTQTRTIPAQTSTEAWLQNQAADYAGNTMNTANGLFGTINSLAGNAGNVYNNYNNTANSINSGYSNLVNGNLPSSYATARQQALNSDLTGTVGSALNNLGSRGILNSSVTTGALDNISKNASDTLAKNYSSDLNNYAGLLGNASANNTSNLSNFEGLISSLIGDSSNLASNTNNLFNTMYSGRMGTGTTQSTTSGGGNTTAQLFGQLGSAAILCFVGGTKIATPNGNKNIEDIVLGDEVYSLNGTIETVIEVQEPQISPNAYVIVSTATTTIKPTDTQLFLTSDGFFTPNSLVGKELVGISGHETVIAVKLNPIKEIVYDFKTTGENIYFANGFAVRGRE